MVSRTRHRLVDSTTKEILYSAEYNRGVIDGIDLRTSESQRILG